ncbi:Carboxylating nicotinate-nucleotide diphosphorylase [Planctomycetales bacterium 10988]|nr:Carboxylating nicotinate-nucleotide diphosphorylase [Planctomycetales bacterium 10988]
MSQANPPTGWTEIEEGNLQALLRLAIPEDIGSGDLTTLALVPESKQSKAMLVAREAGVVAGLPAAQASFLAIDPKIQWNPKCEDGQQVDPGTPLVEVSGSARSLLIGERTALNFLGRLSGIATQTERFVQETEGTNAVILDTRKTLPGWRFLEKYAVRQGGGQNHRVGLFDGVIVKDNHLALRADLPEAEHLTPVQLVEHLRASCPAGTFIEIEVDTLEQFETILPAGPDAILLDNMTLEMMKTAVAVRNAEKSNVLLEASGGVNLATVRWIAETGVDRISVGALTHSAIQFDVALDWIS